MSLLVLALLVGLWSAILLPGAIRARRAASPSSADAFRAALERLSVRAQQEKAAAAAEGTTGSRQPDAAGADLHEQQLGDPRAQAARRAQRRRRVVGAVLAGLLVASAAGAVAVHPAFVWLLVAVAVVAAGYAGLLYGLRSRAEETRRKVTPLPERAPSPSPTPPANGDAAALPQVAGEQH